MDSKMFFIFFCLCICLCNAAVARFENATNPDFPGKCWDPTTEKAYDFDEEFFLEGQCTRGLCSKGFTIQYHTCGAVRVEGCEKVERDLTLPYPKCCQQFKCKDDVLYPKYL